MLKRILSTLLVIASIMNACTSEMPSTESNRSDLSDFSRLDEFAFDYSLNTAYGYLIVISSGR